MNKLYGAILASFMLIFSMSGSALAAVTSPANGATLAGTSQTFTWTDSGASAYRLTAGAAVAGSTYFNSGSIAGGTTSVNVTGLPVQGVPVHVRLYEWINGSWTITDTLYVASAVPVATIQNLTDGGTIPATTPTITWNNVGSGAHFLMLGSYLGGRDLYSSGVLPGTTTSVVASSLPSDARVIYARLYTWGNGAWQTSDTTYHVALAASINSHTNGQTLAGTTTTFTWPLSPGSAGYYLDVGSTFNGHGDYFKSGLISSATNSVFVTGLPVGGLPVYVRLYTWIGNSWQLSDTLYTSAP